MGFDSNLSAHILCVCNFREEKSNENFQAYLFGILSLKGSNVGILSGNGTEFKTKFSMKHVTN